MYKNYKSIYENKYLQFIYKVSFLIKLKMKEKIIKDLQDHIEKASTMEFVKPSESEFNNWKKVVTWTLRRLDENQNTFYHEDFNKIKFTPKILIDKKKVRKAQIKGIQESQEFLEKVSEDYQKYGNTSHTKKENKKKSQTPKKKEKQININPTINNQIKQNNNQKQQTLQKTNKEQKGLFQKIGTEIDGLLSFFKK